MRVGINLARGRNQHSEERYNRKCVAPSPLFVPARFFCGWTFQCVSNKNLQQCLGEIVVLLSQQCLHVEENSCREINLCCRLDQRLVWPCHNQTTIGKKNPLHSEYDEHSRDVFPGECQPIVGSCLFEFCRNLSLSIIFIKHVYRTLIS